MDSDESHSDDKTGDESLKSVASQAWAHFADAMESETDNSPVQSLYSFEGSMSSSNDVSVPDSLSQKGDGHYSPVSPKAKTWQRSHPKTVPPVADLGSTQICRHPTTSRTVGVHFHLRNQPLGTVHFAASTRHGYASSPVPATRDDSIHPQYRISYIEPSV